MSTTQGELASLSKYVFRAPNWYNSVLFALVIAAVAGVGAFDSRFVLEDAWQGIFYLGIPTVVAGLLTTPVDRWLGGQLTYNRSTLLALTCEVVVVVILTLAGLLAVLTRLDQQFVFDALIAGLGLVFAIRLVVVLAVSRNSLFAVVPASIQTATAALLLFIYSGTMRFLEVGGPITRSYLSRPDHAPAELSVIGSQDFLVLGALSVLYVVAAFGLLRMIDRPWKRGLGVSVLDFLRGFVGHIAEGSDELEEFFEQIGEDAVVPLTQLSFRHPGGEEKARFVLPMVHPGPMGDIGGGNLPRRLAEVSEGVAFPPHATAGHDFNLVAAGEVETLVETSEQLADEIDYEPTATQSVRSESGTAKLIGQAFGDGALLAATYSPTVADDVEFAVGLSAAAEARSAGFDTVLLLDCHNCNDGLDGEDLGHVQPGSKRSFDMIAAAGDAATALETAKRESIRLGVAWEPTPWTPRDGIGPLGIRVAVIEVGTQRSAYVLVDGNNMIPGLRDRLVESLSGVEAVEIMTTDTHVVNTVDSVNQVGDAIDNDDLLEAIQSLLDRALADLEPVEAGMASRHVEVTVFGNDRTESLASHANTMMAMGGALAASVVLAVLTLSVLLFFLT